MGTAIHRFLDGWTFNGTVGAEHTAVPFPRPEDRLTLHARENDLARIGGHGLGGGITAMGAGENGFVDGHGNTSRDSH